MKTHLSIAIRFTLATTLLFGILYPLIVTVFSHWMFPAQADGSLITRDGVLVGSRLIGQGFSGDLYFHSRPSAAGAGYDASASSGSNLAPTSQALVDRVKQDVQNLHSDNSAGPVPVDLVTASGSGLDPDISPAAAAFQVNRVAAARKASPGAVEALVARHTLPRQLGVLGEPRVNVLELNLALDQLSK